MGFRYIQSLYDYPDGIAHIAVPEIGEKQLQKMAGDTCGTDDLVAIYIPEGTGEAYEPGDKRGRIVGGVKLLRMPRGRVMRDYFYKDWDGTMRWPLGWPCKAVYAPEISQCRYLRGLVEELWGPHLFQRYVARFQQGPFEIEHAMADKLDKFFAHFPKVTERRSNTIGRK